MGDQVGQAVGGDLHYVPYKEFERILSLNLSVVEKTDLFASLCRINTLYMIAYAGSGHIGSSFSSMDIMSWIMLNEVVVSSKDGGDRGGDIFYSSKGHDAPALYNVMIGLGKLDFDLIHTLRKLDGLPGHPDVSTPNIVTNTGSLGMGVSKAKGMIFANRLNNKSGNVYVMTGDGELQEGQFWESLVSAANHKLAELTVIIDHNKLQSDTLVSKVSDLGDLEAKLSAFGWHVSRCDGNNIAEFSSVLAATKNVHDRPKVIIADTIKGKCVSFMEHTSIDSDVELYKFHSGPPSEDAYGKAVIELIELANQKLDVSGAASLELETVNRSPSAALNKLPQKLIPAYSNSLIEQARKNPKIVALDADLILDTGLIPFKDEFPDRFIESGIAEQDMVSQAGGMALQGLLPIVHSFACFLSTRPNEQIYNNATEKTKIIYVGSLAGLIPAGPGHSHQAVRDISSLSAIPGLTLMEPSCEEEVGMLLDWAINKNSCSSYLRLISVPCDVPFKLPDDYVPVLGQGITLTVGKDIVVIAYGPVMLSIAVNAAKIIKKEKSISVKVINLPWLNNIDREWFINEVVGSTHIISLDNHYRIGGQGDRIADVLAMNCRNSMNLHRLAIDGIPLCGSTEDVLKRHKLDVDYLTTYIYSL